MNTDLIFFYGILIFWILFSCINIKLFVIDEFSDDMERNKEYVMACLLVALLFACFWIITIPILGGYYLLNFISHCISKAIASHKKKNLMG